MNCKNCGNIIELGVNYCSQYGTLQIDNLNNTNTNSSIVNDSYKSDEVLIQEFIVEKYISLKKTKFNVFAFFFGGYYLLYRKMYLYAILWFLGGFVCNIIDSSVLALYSSIMCITFACSFSKICNKFANKKISKIIQKNPNLS